MLQVELELHGVAYTVSVYAHGEELLVVKIEDKDTLDTWHGEFAAKCKLQTVSASSARVATAYQGLNVPIAPNWD